MKITHANKESELDLQRNDVWTTLFATRESKGLSLCQRHCQGMS